MIKTNILIVEDEIIIAKNIQYMLQGLGYNVCGIEDTGEKTIKKAEEAQPELILMDIKIKGDLNGIQTAQQIQLIYNIPIVFLSAYSDEKTLKEAKMINQFGYITKPFEESELFSTIEMALYFHKSDKEKDQNTIQNLINKQKLVF